MKTLIKLEELGMFVITAYFLYQIDMGISKWWYLLLFFAPDLGMIGYAIGPKTGAFVYNIFHHRLVAVAVFLPGLVLGISWLQFTGVLMFSHSSFDRMLGYGLKFNRGFGFTHLGNLKAGAKEPGTTPLMV